jgi:hypothetical protein
LRWEIATKIGTSIEEETTIKARTKIEAKA